MTVRRVGSKFELVSKTGKTLGTHNTRKEAEKHYYSPESSALKKLGFVPTHTLEQELRIMLQDLLPYKARIIELKGAIDPEVHWDPRGKRGLEP